MHWFLDPLQFEFMRNALVAGILVGILCPAVGAYLVVQRMAMLGDVVAHAVLPGLALAHFWGINLLIGAFVSGILSTTIVAWVRTQSRVKADGIMALCLSSFFALGVVLLTKLKNYLSLEDLLFGNILSVSRADVWQMAGITLFVLCAIKLFYRPLLCFTFDRRGAEALGLPVHGINLALMGAMTLAIITGMKAVGAILVMALMVGPAIAAYLLVKELHWMIILGSGLGALASVIGLYLSYYLDLPSGPAIALTVFVLFFLTLLFSPSQGLLIPGKTTSENYPKIPNKSPDR